MCVEFSGSKDYFQSSQPYQSYSAQIENKQQAALKFIDRAKTIVEDILGPENTHTAQPCDHIGRVHVYHHYHDYWGYDGGWWSPVYVVNGRGRAHRDEDDSGARVIIGLLATVVGGFALYHLGKAISHFKQAEEELSEIRPFRYWSVVGKASDSSNVSFCRVVERVAQIEARIFSRIRNQAAYKLVETAGMVAASALTLAGAVYAVQSYVTVGFILGCAAGGSMLFRWGLDSTERDQRRDALELRSVLY